MTRTFTETNLTQAVLERLEGADDARLQRIMTSLIRHLHDFVREVELTEEEWFAAIRFLTTTGQKCDSARQEFVLLSDTLGVSMLVDAINHRRRQGGTPSTVLGPFYVEGAPELPLGANIARAGEGEPTLVAGRVTAPDETPIAGAVLDVWQTAANGYYDTQDSSQPPMNLRGKFRSGADGSYHFRTVKPVSYPIPTDGPVGRMLLRLGRHPYRPAHIHFIVSAEGFQPVTTHVFVADDPYLDSDAVFGVKDALVAPFVRHEAQEEAAALQVAAPFYTLDYDFRLEPAG